MQNQIFLVFIRFIYFKIHNINKVDVITLVGDEEHGRPSLWLCLSMLLTAVSVLFKEQGITVIVSMRSNKLWATLKEF